MAFGKLTLFSRKVILLLLVATPKCDPLCFSAPSGMPLILDPGVNESLCFSAQPRGGIWLDCMGPPACQELSEPRRDVSNYYILSVCMLGLLKLLHGHM